MFSRKSVRPILFLILGATIITEIVALSPSSLEEESIPQPKQIDPATLIPKNQEPTLAPGIPIDRVADYNVENFRYVSVQNKVKQWKIVADKANLYHDIDLVHARRVKVQIYDTDDQITEVTGSEAKYFLGKRDLEMYGNVKTVFPDGFVLHSEYMRYKPNESQIYIPTKHYVQGDNKAATKSDKSNPTDADDESPSTQSQSPSTSSEGRFEFTSYGLNYNMKKGLINLLKTAHVIFYNGSEVTIIDSDKCHINRNTKIAHFTMYPNRPIKKRFVYISQETLFTKARWAVLNYASLNKDVVQYLTAYDDVFIKELGNHKSLRYATSGKAEFNQPLNLIVLTQLPQVYQDADTVTGDIILLHRDTDVVEVEHSNAYTEGDGT